MLRQEMLGITSQRIKDILQTLKLSGYISMKVAKAKPVNLFSNDENCDIIFIVPPMIDTVDEKCLYLFPTQEAILFNDPLLHESKLPKRS